MMAVLAAAVLACTPSPPERRPDVVLVTIDTLRADHCSAYGYEPPTTPFLEELARESVLFETAYAASSWTAPSMASIFTGLAPRTHGVRDGVLARHEHPVAHDILDERFHTLPELLRGAGYRTLGVTTNAHASAATGFGQGFDVLYEDSWQDAPAVARAAERMRDEHGGEGPRFVWLHYFDPHAPYTARKPWVDELGGDPARYEPLAGMSGVKLLREFLDGALDRAELDTLATLYDAEIRATDESLRAVFEILGIGRDALVMVTSDHGEAFGRHELLGHGSSLYEAQARVPLLLRFPPGGPTGRVDAPVSNARVLATVLDWLGIALPTTGGGPSLLPLLGGDGDERPVFLELSRHSYEAHAVRQGRWKLYTQESPMAWSKLFDVAADPLERYDQSRAEPGRLASLAELWRDFSGAHPRFEAPKTPEFSRLEIKKLEALGYMEE